MRGEVLQVVAWAAALLCHVVAADHLRRRLGIIIASQSVLMAIGALAATTAVHRGWGVAAALAAAALAAAVAAMLHILAFAAIGYELLLVATVAVHFIFAEAWLGASAWTGGSGGRLVASRSTTAVVSLVLTAVGIVVVTLAASKSELRFSWLMTKSLGVKGGVVGVPSTRLLGISFALTGLSAGLCGAAIVFLSGYLSIASFPLVWPLVALSIALVTRAIPLYVTLCLVYASIHVLLRARAAPTLLGSHAWEVTFPLLLLILAVCRNSLPGRESRALARRNTRHGGTEEIA